MRARAEITRSFDRDTVLSPLKCQLFIKTSEVYFIKKVTLGIPAEVVFIKKVTYFL